MGTVERVMAAAHEGLAEFKADGASRVVAFMMWAARIGRGPAVAGLGNGSARVGALLCASGARDAARHGERGRRRRAVGRGPAGSDGERVLYLAE